MTTRPAASDRSMRLHVVRLGLWSVAKIAFIAAVIVAALFVLGVIIAWTTFTDNGGLRSLAVTISGDPNSTGLTSLVPVLNTGTIVGAAVALGVVQIVLTTVLAVIGALLYNVTIRFTGGVLAGFSASRRSSR